VNVNLRPYYAEGSKTFGYEIAEQLGWRVPQHVVCPMAAAADRQIHKAFGELEKIGLVASGTCGCTRSGGRLQPIADMVKNNRDAHRPVRRPNTIAKSLASATRPTATSRPADPLVGRWCEDATDDEIREAMVLLAKTEGIFAETAGGVTVAVAKKLIEQGRIPRDEEIVICVTGNGLKTQDAVAGVVEEPAVIRPSLEAFSRRWPGGRAGVGLKGSSHR